jgi:hypothetical protein
MPSGSFLGYLLSLVFVFQMLVVASRVASWARLRRMAGAISGMVPQDISHQETPPPAAANAIIVTLAGLGFRRLGEVSVSLPGTRPATLWLYTEPERGIHAEVGVIGPVPMVVFITLFGEHAVIETAYPRGTMLEQPGFVAQVVSTSVRDAYEAHATRAHRMQAQHGQPRHIDTMPAFIDYSRIYNTRFGGRKTTAALPIVTVRAASSGYTAAVIAAGLLLNWLTGLSDSALLAGVALAIIPAMIADVAVYVWARRRRVLPV